MEVFIASPFRMGHHPKYVFLPITNTCYIENRTIWVVVFIHFSVDTAILKQHLIVGKQIVQSGFIGKVTTLSMGNWYFVHLLEGQLLC